MSALEVEVLDVLGEQHAASPHLLFRLRINETSGAVVHALALRVQLRLEPQRRPYAPDEQTGLIDLFGTPDRYASTLKPFLWTHATAMVPGFTTSTEVDLAVPVTYDFDVSATKYLHALRDGAAPVVLLFSGTCFTRGESGFAVEQLSWSLEARCELPVHVWRSVMDHYFPGGGWIRLDRETIAALSLFRSERGLTSWEAALAELLPTAVPR